MSSPGSIALADGWQVNAGQTVQAFYTAGDTQSAADELAVFYRLNQHGIADEWHLARTSPLTLRPEIPDTLKI